MVKKVVTSYKVKKKERREAREQNDTNTRVSYA